MPKMKTKSGAKKRSKFTANGKIEKRPGRQAPPVDQALQRPAPATCAAPRFFPIPKPSASSAGCLTAKG